MRHVSHASISQTNRTRISLRWYACRRPDFLIAQKVSKDAPGRGKIPNFSPLPGPSPHSNGQKGSSPFWISPQNPLRGYSNPECCRTHSGLSPSACETERRDEHCSSGIRNECNLPQANPTYRFASTQGGGVGVRRRVRNGKPVPENSPAAAHGAPPRGNIIAQAPAGHGARSAHRSGGGSAQQP